MCKRNTNGDGDWEAEREDKREATTRLTETKTHRIRNTHNKQT